MRRGGITTAERRATNCSNRECGLDSRLTREEGNGSNSRGSRKDEKMQWREAEQTSLVLGA
jgi:hypothetical protein